MKKIYAKKIKAYKNIKQYSLLALLLMAFSFYSYGQVIKPFTPRVSSATGKSVYTVKGDFAIIGNTNLTPKDYNAGVADSREMIYVDVDGDSNTLNSSSATLQLKDDNGTVTDCSNILYAGLYWTGRPGPDNTFEASNGTITKTLSKHKVSISGPSSGSYTDVVANENDIYYPQGTFSDMFIAYADVTDYVKLNGTGNYDVADIALYEGLGGNVGFFGGWSMVIVYENSTMKMRNISVFDGYAFRESNLVGHDDFLNINISALNTSNGDLNTQIGVMAAEGDLSLEFDYFEIEKGTTSNYLRLAHQGNLIPGSLPALVTRNFFNSSISVGGSPRNPNLINNTGIGFSKFDLPNTQGTNTNRLINIGQPNLRFKYNALQDKYVIYNLTLSFEAPAPEIEAEVAITNINGVPNNSATTTVLPGQSITYKVDVKNFGIESTTGSMLSIPLPYNTTYQSLNYNSYSPYSSANAPVYNAATNAIEWNLGNLPVATRTDDLLASVNFTVTATTDCTLLVVECANLISLNGTISGTGSDSGSSFDKTLITGYDTTAGCVGTPLPAPIYTTIDAVSYVNANCAGVPVVKNFYYCASSSTTIPTSDISSTYPQGTRFYNEYPVTSSTIEYTNSNPFPGNDGSTTYYAVPAGSESCYFEFIINVNSVTSVPTVSPDPISYCLNETAVPLTATPSDAALTLYYYTDNNPSTAPQASITPNTDVAGTFTYYVAEGPSPDCISENRVAITVTVNDILDVSSSITDSSCTPGSDGSIDLTVTGGSGNYTYLWSTSATTQDITGLMPGIYVVTITDVTTGCDTVSSFEVKTDLTSFPTITAPTAYALEGCDLSVITGLPVSTTPISITLDQLQSAEAGGGTATGFSAITYMDVVLGTCPTVVTRTFTATNDCNNATTATQTITIQDTEAPITPTAPADVTIECSDDLPPMVDLSATDNCSLNPTITVTGVDTTNNTDPCNVIVTRTWTFTDDCGNSSEVSQIITIVDTTDPVLDTSAQDSITIYCNGEEKNDTFDAWLAIHAGVVASDNCTSDNDIVWTNNYNEADASPCDTDFKSVTFTATDACGNSSTVIGQYRFNDIVGPVFVDQASDATFECGDDQGLQNWLNMNGGASAIDECSETIDWSNNFTTVSNECGNTGSALVTFSATDACGNTTTSPATVTIVDTTAPVAPTAPADITVQCIDDIPTAANLTATDNCSSTITVTTNDTTNDTNPCDIIVTRTWTFTDECGNASQTSQTINVIDTTAPIAPSAPADVTVECTTDLPAMIDLTATDNCGELITATGVDTTNNTDICNIIVTRTWTFTDTCGNTSSTSQTIIVKDETAPVPPAAPAAITVSCLDLVPQPTDLVAMDNCSGAITAMGVDSALPSDSCNTIINRTWTFADDCGNTSSVTQIINIVDDVAPIITADPADITYVCNGEERNITIDGWIAINGGALAEDNCSNVTWTNNYDPNLITCNEATEVIFTATDDCGNSVSKSASYTVIDTTGPDVTTEAQDVSIECGDVNSPILLDWLNTNGGAMAQDICSAISWENNYDPSLLTSGTVPVTFVATDECGNPSSTTANIIITDSTAPIPPTAPADVTVECSDIPPMVDLTATDNCGETITVAGVDSVNDTDPCSLIITRTWTFTDLSGNSSETSQIITAIDTQAPIVPTIPADVTVECSDGLPAMVDLTATDDCGLDITVAPVDTTDNTNPCRVIVTRTWNFEDACGNVSTGSQIITVVDETAPVITAPASDIVIVCNGDERNVTIDGWISINGGALAEDSCSNVTWTNNYDPSLINCNEATEVVFTATDDCGNSTLTSASYTIIDTTAPDVTTEAQDISVECGDVNSPVLLEWLNTNGGAMAQDICSTVSWENNYDPSLLTSGTVPVTFVATDECGNASSTTANIIITDSTAPIPPTAPADVTVECSNIPPMVDLTATDNCGETITVAGVDSVNDTDPCSLIITRTWTFTDLSGNSSETSQIITAIDTQAPIVPTIPADVTVECSDGLPAMVDLTATDDCGLDITVAPVDTTDNTNPCRVIVTRTWNFEDACGNVSTGSQIITVVDETAPVITAPASDIVIECDGDERNVTIDGWLAINAGALAEDSCSNVTWTNNYDPNAESCNNAIEVTFTATDACGNSTSTSASYTVHDETAPTIDTEPSDLVYECDANSDSTLNTWLDSNGGAMATDYCSDVTWTNDFDPSSISSDSCGPDNAITVTFTASDYCGNTIQTTATITVIDITAPIVPTNVPADITVECYDDIPAMIDLTATDNCAGDITVAGIDTEDNSDPTNIIIVRTWTFTDACGNASEVSQTITVKDETAPVVDSTIPSDLAVECIDDVPPMEPLTATDNCAGTITSNGTETINDADACNIIITRTWIFADNSGNTTEVNQTITVKDETAPVVDSTPTDMNIECESDVPAMEPLTATDNCAGTITSAGTETVNNSDPLSIIITRTWSFTDACGNTTEVSQIITVKDVTAPVVNTPPTDMTYACIDDVPELGPLTATDNCSGEITSEGTETIDNADSCNVIITRTWMFTDNSENSTEVTQVITVKDDVAPTAPSAPADVTVECLDDIPANIDLTATDNCGGEITSTGVDTVVEIDSCSRIITRTWTFTDACENTSEISQIITVADVTPPTLVNSFDTNVTVNCSAIPAKPELEFTDNCTSILNVVYTEENTSTGAAYENYQIIRDWTVTDSCNNSSEFTQTIDVNVQQEPVLESDSKCTEGGDINLDSYLVDPSTAGTWVVDSGDTTLNGSTFDPSDVEVGAYVFTFTEADGCQNQTTVTININEDCVEPTCDPIISTTVTPNGDQWNEYFSVTGLDRCGFVVNVEIYNRWGSLVFKANNYSNDWNGKNSKGAFGNADQLPTGTYYYIVTLNNSGLKPITGPIYLGTK
ncbi:gliding motility-associated C-terminal domain-containing protein [Formosa sp. PL04]|uniref:HYR-like domain-containing protein n=1 Tax=Formosa sp. PL04 TaxID=3081755 RepID=UPI0029826A79|nr:gliding motility-associated C-terminal domain-containing protein [Formosa sp. PL04]MDW5289383.1 gliding motility-associated C-terminal domain-containing protein [Formosa sp. PL04]